MNHDAPTGPLKHCQITGSKDLWCLLDLGAQPMCDALLDSPDEPEMHYPLSLWLCPESGLAQLGYVLPKETVYPPSYPYRSGISAPLVEYQHAMAAALAERFGDGSPHPLAVDIGSNDGTLLSGFKARGWRALGIEPTDVANIAREENGIFTRQEYFGQALALEIVEMYGRPKVITATNVFAHMADLGEFMRGIVALLTTPDAVFVTETHYLLDVLTKRQFDTIYHEHVRTYSLRSLVTLFRQYGLEVFDVERGERYGGNIRAYVAQKGVRQVESRVADLLAYEESMGLFSRDRWDQWTGEVRDQRDRFMGFLHDAARAGKTFAGCSAPGRASTLINYYGIPRDIVTYTGELHNSLKLGKYLPGSRIAVVPNTRLKENPDYIILFAWHYGEVIRARLRAEGITSTFIEPLPKFSTWSMD